MEMFFNKKRVGIKNEHVGRNTTFFLTTDGFGASYSVTRAANYQQPKLSIAEQRRVANRLLNWNIFQNQTGAVYMEMNNGELGLSNFNRNSLENETVIGWDLGLRNGKEK